jgi:hypothetical protein
LLLVLSFASITLSGTPAAKSAQPKGSVAIGEPSDPVWKAFPQTGKFLATARVHLFTCQLKEHLARQSFELFLLRQHEKDKHQSEQAIKDVQACAGEVETAMSPLYRAALRELSPKPQAQEKLKPYFSRWLAILKGMPRYSLREVGLMLRQSEDDQTLNRMESELKAELI